MHDLQGACRKANGFALSFVPRDSSTSFELLCKRSVASSFKNCTGHFCCSGRNELISEKSRGLITDIYR